MEFVGQFFSAFPDVASAFWNFAGGIRVLFIVGGSILLTAGLAFAALRLRDDSGWLSAILGMMSATIVMWWAFGILPSAWVFFASSQQDLLGGRVIPNSLPLASNFYDLFRDLVVVIETSVAVLGFAVVCLWIQKRYPRSLAEGEGARPQSGGYK